MQSKIADAVIMINLRGGNGFAFSIFPSAFGGSFGIYLRVLYPQTHDESRIPISDSVGSSRILSDRICPHKLLLAPHIHSFQWVLSSYLSATP